MSFGNGTFPSRNLDIGSENNPLVAVVSANNVGGRVRLVVPAPLQAEGDNSTITLDEFGNLRVGAPLGGVVLPVAPPFVTLIRSDKDTDFAGASAANNQLVGNLVGLPRNSGTIIACTLLAEQNLAWDVCFWTRDTFSTADMDTDTFLDQISFPAASAITIANGVPATFRYAMSDLQIPYRDQDTTLELHVSLIPRGGAKLAAGAGGNVVLQFSFRQDAP